MKKQIQRLVVSSLFVLSMATVGAILVEVTGGALYGNGPACPNCDVGRGCPGSPAGRCTCPSGGTVCVVDGG